MTHVAKKQPFNCRMLYFIDHWVFTDTNTHFELKLGFLQIIRIRLGFTKRLKNQNWFHFMEHIRQFWIPYECLICGKLNRTCTRPFTEFQTCQLLCFRHVNGAYFQAYSINVISITIGYLLHFRWIVQANRPKLSD